MNSCRFFLPLPPYPRVGEPAIPGSPNTSAAVVRFVVSQEGSSACLFLVEPPISQKTIIITRGQSADVLTGTISACGHVQPNSYSYCGTDERHEMGDDDDEGPKRRGFHLETLQSSENIVSWFLHMCRRDTVVITRSERANGPIEDLPTAYKLGWTPLSCTKSMMVSFIGSTL